MATARAAAPRWFASHELRTPLQAIKGGVELLLEGRGAGLSALQVDAVGLIGRAAVELEHCILMLAELAGLDDEPLPPIEPLRLGAWLAEPSIARHLAPSSRLTELADLAVLVAMPTAARALAHLTTIKGSAEPFACDLAVVAPSRCVLRLSIGALPSGDGAVGRQLATALFARAGIELRPTGPASTLMTLRRAA